MALCRQPMRVRYLPVSQLSWLPKGAVISPTVLSALIQKATALLEVAIAFCIQEYIKYIKLLKVCQGGFPLLFYLIGAILLYI